MEPTGKLEHKKTPNIVMLLSTSKYVLVKFADQCTHIINNTDNLNWLKGSTKMQI